MLARKKARLHPVMGHKRALRYSALRRVYSIANTLDGGGQILSHGVSSSYIV